MDSCAYKYSTGRVAIYSWAPGWLLEACYAMSCGSEFNIILLYFRLLDTISANVGVMRQRGSTQVPIPLPLPTGRERQNSQQNDAHPRLPFEGP